MVDIVDLEQWMTNLSPEEQARPIVCLKIPGKWCISMFPWCVEFIEAFYVIQNLYMNSLDMFIITIPSSISEGYQRKPTIPGIW